MATRKTTRRTQSKPAPKHAYRLLVKLDGSEPAIWRLLSVPGHMTLADLDRIIQAAMGWTNSHLHQFAIEGNFYGLPDDEWMDEMPLLADELFTLDNVLGTTVKASVYEYDFGVGWSHDITVQAIELVDEERNGWPMYLAGANACRPGDVGGATTPGTGRLTGRVSTQLQAPQQQTAMDSALVQPIDAVSAEARAA